MASNKRKKKVRAEFRKKHQGKARATDWTRQFDQQSPEVDESAAGERLSGKGELTRKRTVIGESSDDESSGIGVRLEVDEGKCFPGRVLSVHGAASFVLADSGETFRCATRRLLKSLSTDQRNVVAAGDRVLFRPEGIGQGMIERVEPRHGVLSRTSRGRRHVIAVNIDQLLVVTSAAQPTLKPNLIDRFLITAEQAGIEPVICINKVDLVEPADLQPLAGVYGRMGYRVLSLSAETGFGVESLRRTVADRQSVIAGQSGVGKTSLLNAIEPGLELRVGRISRENEKGTHTTTAACLIGLQCGGFIVDTPGIRQFQLWDVIPEEIAGLMRDIRPYVSFCRYPDCSHIHETDCAVKDAVADTRLDLRRYESYCQMFLGDELAPAKGDES